MGQSVFLAGRHSLILTREARRSPELRLAPAPGAHRDVVPDHPNARALRAVLPEVLLPVSPAAPLEVTSFSREGRSKSALVSSRCLLSQLPEGSFLEVTRVDGRGWETPGGEALRLFVECPALALIRAQQELERAVRSGLVSPTAVFFQLLARAMEACGSYARDPRSPYRGPCAFDLPPIAEPEGMRAFLTEATGIKGIAEARRAAAHVLGGAGSPEETLLACALSLPFELGGMSSPTPVLNEPVRWPEEVAHLVEHRRMRPDINFPAHAVAAEYNGRTHMDSSSFEEDQRRIRDYQLCGISVFPAAYADVRTPQALASYLARLVHALAAREPPGYEGRAREALADEGMTHMRRVLLSQMLPAVPSEKGRS